MRIRAVRLVVVLVSARALLLGPSRAQLEKQRWERINTFCDKRRLRAQLTTWVGAEVDAWLPRSFDLTDAADVRAFRDEAQRQRLERAARDDGDDSDDAQASLNAHGAWIVKRNDAREAMCVI